MTLLRRLALSGTLGMGPERRVPVMSRNAGLDAISLGIKRLTEPSRGAKIAAALRQTGS